MGNFAQIYIGTVFINPVIYIKRKLNQNATHFFNQLYLVNFLALFGLAGLPVSYQ